MAKPQAFPLVFRISSQPSRIGSQRFGNLFAGFCSISSSGRENFKTSRELGFYTHSVFVDCKPFGAKCFSSSYGQEGAERSETSLPWLATSSDDELRKVRRNEVNKRFKSSWEESAENFLRGGAASTQIRKDKMIENRISELRDTDGVTGDAVDEEDESVDVEVANDPRWNTIKERVNKLVNGKPRYERVEVRKWSNEEKWGRKTWKEAKESSVPKMVGEGIYGVGPVLAALLSARREFYALYVQEGMDMSTNYRKKKDKKGFEKVLNLADKVGLSKKEVSKHDLNMVVDNRPHQGLVLDASPLEMVGIKELEPVSVEGEMGPLWLALDEVTDPQNLGAIIRSAYFFGVAGVVLCAKNSAPLSGVVSKASAGSLEIMEVRSCKNVMQFLTSSAGNGWRVIGGSVSPRAIPLNTVVPGAPTILVLGSEGTGLRPLVERSCSQLIRVPGNLPIDAVTEKDEAVDGNENPGQEFRSFLAVESLNVSVAAGVLLNHLIGGNQNNVIIQR